MKKTLWMTVLAAALLGGQVFAATGTAIDGASYTQGTNYYGAYSASGSVTGGNVTIKTDSKGEVPSSAYVYGGYTLSESAGTNVSYNTVTMTGGAVEAIEAGCAAMGGDEVSASNNVVIITGGSVKSVVYAGDAWGGILTNNKVHLVGKGASNVSIANAQGITSTYNYTGGDAGITLRSVGAGNVVTFGTTEGNSIGIYGTGITAYNMLFMQILAFNITDGQAAGQTSEAALSLTATSAFYALNLEGVALQVNDLDVTKWTPGTTITLVESKVAIKGLTEPEEVEIKRGDVVTATGTLKLNEDSTQLLLTNIQGKVPEPMTGTLGLLALAALAARRRKH